MWTFIYGVFVVRNVYMSHYSWSKMMNIIIHNIYKTRVFIRTSMILMAVFLSFQNKLEAVETFDGSVLYSISLPFSILLGILLLGFIFILRRRVKSFEQKVINSHDILETTLERTTRDVERLRHACELVSLIYYEYDIEKGVFTGDKGLYMLFVGEVRESLSLEEIIEHVHPDDRYLMSAYPKIQENRSTGETLKVEGRIYNVNNELRYMRVYAKSYFDENGVLVSRKGSMLDITDEKTNELELLRINSQLEYVQKLAKVYTWEIALDEPNYIKISRDFFRMVYGKYEGDCRELVSSLKDVVDKDDYENLVDGIQNRVVKKLPFEMTLAINPLDDSDVKYVHLRLFTNEENKYVGDEVVMGVIQDITDLKKAEQRVGHSDKMKALGRMASGIAHDFNNQLSGILGFAELAKQEEMSEKVGEYVNLIIDRGEEASDLVKKLLDFSKDRKEEVEVVDIDELITDSVNFFSHLAGKSIIIKKNIIETGLGVLGNFGELQNTLLNLGINSRDALGDKSGEIVFGATSVILGEKEASELEISMGKYVVISVSDNGGGMTEVVKEQALEPFFSTKQKSKGTGLGLSTVHGTIYSLGGSIKIDTKPGKGTKVSIYLPAVARDVVAETRKVKKDSELQSGEGKVLLIDDDKTLVRLVTMQLEKAGYQATGVDNPVEAVKHYEDNYANYDLVILDMIMPEMNGAEVFRELKRINSEVKAIIMSGYSGEGLFDEAKKEGIKYFLNKPVTLTALTNMVAKVMGINELEVKNEI